MQRLRNGVLGKRRGGVARFQRKAEEHGVVSDRVKVERCGHLDLIARRVLDRLALGKAVGVIGCGGRAKVIGVKGVFSVHMQVTKIGIAERVRGWRPAIQNIHRRLEGVASTPSKIVVLVD